MIISKYFYNPTNPLDCSAYSVIHIPHIFQIHLGVHYVDEKHHVNLYYHHRQELAVVYQYVWIRQTRPLSIYIVSQQFVAIAGRQYCQFGMFDDVV